MVFDDVMQSDAYRAIPDFAKSVLWAIAAQYRGSNNGDLDLPSRKAAEYGVDPSEKYDSPAMIPKPASNEWVSWRRPDDWDDVVRRIWQRAQGRKTIAHSAREEQAVPHGGNENSVSYSARGERNGRNFIPHGGDTLLESGRGGLQDQVMRMIRSHPHMSDVDVAVVFKFKVDRFEVARIRQSLVDQDDDVA